MAKLEKEQTFTNGIEQVFRGIKRFDQYPKYLPGVTKIEVLPAKTKGSVCQVRYELNIIKTFYYLLDMFEESPNKLWWQLVDSNLMKQNDGSWELKAISSNETKALYSLQVKFKGLIPSAITDQVAKANLPLMFAGFQRLIDASK